MPAALVAAAVIADDWRETPVHSARCAAHAITDPAVACIHAIQALDMGDVSAFHFPQDLNSLLCHSVRQDLGQNEPAPGVAR